MLYMQFILISNFINFKGFYIDIQYQCIFILHPHKKWFSNTGVSNISVAVVKKGKLTIPVQYV